MPNMDSADELLSVSDVAELLCLSPRAIRHRAKAGTLPAVKMPGRTGSYVFRRRDIDAILEATS